MPRVPQRVHLEQHLGQAAIDCHAVDQAGVADEGGDDGANQDEHRVRDHDELQPSASRDLHATRGGGARGGEGGWEASGDGDRRRAAAKGRRAGRGDEAAPAGRPRT